MKQVFQADFPLEAIVIPERFRKDFGDLTELSDSIKEKGLIQPITLNIANLELVTGERRYRASKLAGLTTVPVILREVTSDLDYRELELFENLHRKAFAWSEEVALLAEIDTLMKAKHSNKWSLNDTANLTDRSKSDVHRKLELARALEVLPQLAECKSESEARKLLQKATEHAVVQELRGRQVERMKTSADKFLLRASSNYGIGNSLVELESLRDNGVINYINCDPPYGIDLDEVKNQEGSRPETYKEIPRSSYHEFLAKLCALLFKKAGPHCWMTFWYGPTHHQLVLTSLRAAGWEVDEINAIWTKTTGQTLQPELYLARAYEPFFICRKGQPALIKRGRSNVFSFPAVPASRKYHPTEKPIELSSELLSVFTTPGATVLIPFLGSGVDLRACYLAGNSGFGWDLDPQYKDRFMLEVEADMKALDSQE